MIYDCFTFFNELDLLEIRLHELYNVVDKFVIIEADRTHSNLPKPFYYDLNKDRFKQFEDKIIHIKHEHTELMYKGGSFDIDNATRDLAISEIHYEPDDLIIIDDADQILRASILENFIYNGPAKYETKYYYYYFNCVHNGGWYSTLIYKYKDMNKPLHELRFNPPLELPFVYNAGWHFSYLGDIENIKLKVQSFSHAPECFIPKFMNDEHLLDCLNTGKDLFDRGKEANMFFVPIDDSFPKYLVDNQEKFKEYIKQI